jgi:hypothetical protein
MQTVWLPSTGMVARMNRQQSLVSRTPILLGCQKLLPTAVRPAVLWHTPVGQQGYRRKLGRVVVQQQASQAGAASPSWAHKHKHLQDSDSQVVLQGDKHTFSHQHSQHSSKSGLGVSFGLSQQTPAFRI